MSDFSSGVKGYVFGAATVGNFFPVDLKGNADVCCKQCRFFHINSRKCALNGALVAYPERYIGSECPFDFEDVKKGKECEENE